jgi:hypothetical protein
MKEPGKNGWFRVKFLNPQIFDSLDTLVESQNQF